MSALEVNKIIASIIVAFIVVLVISHLGDIIIKVNNDNLKETAYKIEIQDVESSTKETNENMENIESISTLLASASSEKGEKIFKKCSSCHTYKKEGVNKAGPNLWNIINKPKANVSGFAYSKELSDFGGKWEYEELAAFLYKPTQYIKGTKMNFSGLKKVQDRADLVIFLREQSDNPVELP
tara:strand:- start:17119 stop:17664 length:546 start_codon:yes stop_codon:yes gene_type:complete